jgi:TATA-box binding protein (TBP) (component of TFIID and TFIIIB)
MCDDEWLQFCSNDSFESSTTNDTTRDEKPPCPKSSDLYISTKSKIGYLNKEMNLTDIYWKIPMISYHQNKEGVIKKQIKLTLQTSDEIDENIASEKNAGMPVDVEDISKKKNKIIHKISIGTSSKDLVSYRTKKKGAFYNCFVIIFRLNYHGRYKEMHVKIFNTGKMEIPGVPKDDILSDLLDKLLKLLNSPEMNLDVKIMEDSFETVLINSNFNCGFNIQRENLVDILKLNYKMSVSYDPCSYPGIMCKYYYYPTKSDSEQDGRLYKGENAICISFMIFRTGSVLIVGKCNTTDIIYLIYDFIQKILSSHYDNIYAITNEASHKQVVKKKKIKKKRIVCYL